MGSTIFPAVARTTTRSLTLPSLTLAPGLRKDHGPPTQQIQPLSGLVPWSGHSIRVRHRPIGSLWDSHNPAARTAALLSLPQEEGLSCWSSLILTMRTTSGLLR